MESPYASPDSPVDTDDALYPCKGCGEILEEGKAFELAGHRWHIDCFKCSQCNTLLDSDANLLLLGDGSLICNNCTYSCSGCGNKIEDLAILTGDQAFCATCFRCRNCKRKIENLKYARTSQGIFCMNCHEALMARRRKRPKGTSSRHKNSAQLDKSLPAIPPPDARKTAFIPQAEESLYAENYGQPAPDAPSVSRTVSELRPEPDSDSSRPPTSSQSQTQGPTLTLPSTTDSLTLPSTTYNNNRHSYMSAQSEMSTAGGEEFLIPLAFDPTPVRENPPASTQSTPRGLEERPKDYFNGSTAYPGTTTETSQNTSPQITLQENGRQKPYEATENMRHKAEGSISRSVSANASSLGSTEPSKQQHSREYVYSSQPAKVEAPPEERFKLQDPPRKAAFSTTTEPKSGGSTPRADPVESKPSVSTSQSTEILSNRAYASPDSSRDISPRSSEFVESPRLPVNAATSMFSALPKRGDSLESAKRTIPRKEINTSAAISPAFTELNKDAASSPKPADLAKANGGKVISAPIASPESASVFETPNAPQWQDPEKGSESFVDPRAPPPPPVPEYARSRAGSIATQQSDQRLAEGQRSPKLPRWSGAGDFTLEEDMARILGGDEPHSSFLRRVSNSVRHGRSYSAQSGRTPRDRFPKSPIVGGSGQDISSPTSASPEHREELAWFRNQLKIEKEKNVMRERKIAELEAQLDQSASINKVNSELKEKRSTMVVLDTQKEIVVRELEVLTEHIAKAKASKEPLDLAKMNNTVLRDFAESLEKLKNSFTPQIEEYVEKRNALLDEITRLTTMKEKSFSEFEQLSSKNAQLAELNNQLVHQIQDIYKSSSGVGTEPSRSPAPPNGLGIYSHHKDKSQISIESRDTKPGTSEASIPESTATTIQGDIEPITVVGGPNVVSIKKIQQPKKFDWRKGQKVAKGMAKGVKGAFSSTQQSYNRDMQFAETGAYGQLTPQEYNNHLARTNTEPPKQGFGFFGGNQKPPVRGNGLYATPQGNASTPSIGLDPSTNLFGSDLEARADYEKTDIPAIVKRCVEEVETRGMDVEGIYRKSGGNSQVQQVKESFERASQDYDISDPDLDIHAVTSGLKQYFRRLPSPLITYNVYDTLLEATSVPEGPNQHMQRIDAIQKSLQGLPKVHYDTLEYLIRHLAKVVVYEKENLMTPTNIAVVFAPTIMRPESVSRELTDTKAKNEVVTWMVEDYAKVFGR